MDPRVGWLICSIMYMICGVWYVNMPHGKKTLTNDAIMMLFTIAYSSASFLIVNALVSALKMAGG